MDTNETISALRVPLMECDERPWVIIDREWPKNFLRHSWCPQTIVDSIWVLFEFRTLGDRVAWERSLSATLRGWLDRRVIEPALAFGWVVRDENGFDILDLPHTLTCTVRGDGMAPDGSSPLEFKGRRYAIDSVVPGEQSGEWRVTAHLDLQTF
jgi:hypothetical protein